MNKHLIRNYSTHLGTIFFKYMIFFLVLSVASAFSFVFVLFYWVILFAIGMMSLFILFFDEGFQALFTNGEKIIELSIYLFPIFSGIGMVLSLLSLGCFLVDRHNPNNKGKIIASSIIAGIFVIVLIIGILLMLKGTGNIWNT